MSEFERVRPFLLTYPIVIHQETFDILKETTRLVSNIVLLQKYKKCVNIISGGTMSESERMRPFLLTRLVVIHPVISRLDF